jgi:hypothetical protein
MRLSSCVCSADVCDRGSWSPVLLSPGTTRSKQFGAVVVGESVAVESAPVSAAEGGAFAGLDVGRGSRGWTHKEGEL